MKNKKIDTKGKEVGEGKTSLWDFLKKSSFIATSTILAAAIGFGGAYMGAAINRSSNESMQIFAVKQEKYSNLIEEMQLEFMSFRTTLDYMSSGDIEAAAKNIKKYDHYSDFVKRMSSVLIVANGNIASALLSYFESLGTLQDNINDLAAQIDKKIPIKAAQVDQANKNFNDLLDKESILILEIRHDLGIPDG